MTDSLKEVATNLKPDEPSLLPCPFCGCDALVQPTYDIDTGECDGYFAWCSNYECECKPQTRNYITEAEAIEAWNTRAERTCRDVHDWRDSNGVLHRDARIFKCSECGFKADDFYGDDEQSFPRYCPNCGRRCI